MCCPWALPTIDAPRIRCRAKPGIVRPRRLLLHLSIFACPVKYMEAERYTVNCDDAEYVFAIGAEEGGRPSYQRDDRGRIVVFIRSRRSENSYYPLVEFAESDLGPDLYAAIVPQPAAPKKGTTADDLSDLREVPHLANADLRRADEVFLSLRNGPSLRLLVDRNNPELMIKHAWWVGGLRGTSS